MVFLEYAGTLSPQKDSLKIKILTDPKLVYPDTTLDGPIPVVRLPEPMASEENIEFLGYTFPEGEESRIKIGRLFRAAVVHAVARTQAQPPITLKARSHSAEFIDVLLTDFFADLYVAVSNPERLLDLAYANAFALSSTRSLENIFLPSTRVMTALLSTVFVGNLNGSLYGGEEDFVGEAVRRISVMKERFTEALSGKEVDAEELEENANQLIDGLRDFGPFVEKPIFPHVGDPSSCSIYHRSDAPLDHEVEPYFMDSLETFGGESPEEVMASSWRKQVDVECLQAFSSNLIQRRKEAKIVRELEERLLDTRFKSIEVPGPSDYSEYLRARELIGGSTRRLLNNIIIASNFEFEDIRKKYGVLNLQDAIQVVASDSPRNDIFMRDEIMKRSFSIVILLDVSKSMKTNPIENRARAICIAEAAKDIITDSHSWAVYAFSDRLYVIKDGSEAYSRMVRGRIGAVPFDGATYMPDAIVAAADFLKDKVEEQRIIFILSDGFPFGYPEIHEVLEEVTRTYEELGVIIIGVGVDTERMGKYFRYSTPVYSQKDLVKKVGSVFLTASMEELL
jgi:uncharacterized protein YegL